MHNFNDAVKDGLLDAVFSGLDVPTVKQTGIEEIRKNDGVSAEAVQLLYLYNRCCPRGSAGWSRDLFDEICALSGQKYTIDGITPEQHADYSAKYHEMTKVLGLNLAPPEAVPIAKKPDPATARMWHTLKDTGALPRK